MNMLTELRIAVVAVLSALDIPVWDRRVPKDEAEPEMYILATSQTMSDSDRSKCGNETKECTMLLSVIRKTEQGYADSIPVDQACADIVSIIDRNRYMALNGFVIMDTVLESVSVEDAFEFDTQTVVRGLVRFRFKIR